MLIVMSLYMYIEHLHGVHVSDEKLFSLSGDDGPQLLEWGRNGFRMQVPEGATSGACDNHILSSIQLILKLHTQTN